MTNDPICAQLRALEAECGELGARLRRSVESVDSLSSRSGQNNSSKLALHALTSLNSRLHVTSDRLDLLQRRLSARDEKKSFLPDSLFNEIQSKLGLPSLDSQLQALQGSNEFTRTVEIKNRQGSGKEPAWSPSSMQQDPTYSVLIDKYSQDDASRTGRISPIAHEIAFKYAVPDTKSTAKAMDITAAMELTAHAEAGAFEGNGDPGDPDNHTLRDQNQAVFVGEEETTMELKNQLIFSALNRNPGQRSSRPVSSRPEPIKDLADLPIEPTPRQETGIDDERLEDAITTALAKSCEVRERFTRKPITNVDTKVATATTETTTATTPATGILESGKLFRSAPKSTSVLTPKVPTSLAPWRAIDEDSFNNLPSFVRGQITLDELNLASKAVHNLVAHRIEIGEGSVAFRAMDVDEHSPDGKGKVVLNALTKLNLVKIKVVYGDGTVYFFA